MAKVFLPHPQKRDAAHIEKQMKRFEGFIMTFPAERHGPLLTMYEDYGELLRTAPASAKVQYHNAYPGGYLDHVLHVIDNAHLVKRLFNHIGGVPDCTDEEITFAAMHHDLGKLGDPEDGPIYTVEEDSFWQKKGSYFGYNDNRQRMTTYDRTIFTLQKYGVKFTQNEMVGIRMADGVFDPSNKAYYEAPAPYAHRTNIGYLIHWADWMSTIAEKDVMRKQFENSNGK